VNPASRGNAYFKLAAERLGERSIPGWLQFDGNRMAGRMLTTPERQAVDLPLNEQLIVEYYSR
jgi:small subunit ribosomal protein S4